MTTFYRPLCILHANIMNLTRINKNVKNGSEVFDSVQ
jgi:hypothetical protein